MSAVLASIDAPPVGDVHAKLMEDNGLQSQYPVNHTTLRTKLLVFGGIPIGCSGRELLDLARSDAMRVALTHVSRTFSAVTARSRSCPGRRCMGIGMRILRCLAAGDELAKLNARNMWACVLGSAGWPAALSQRVLRSCGRGEAEWR